MEEVVSRDGVLKFIGMIGLTFAGNDDGKVGLCQLMR